MGERPAVQETPATPYLARLRDGLRAAFASGRAFAAWVIAPWPPFALFLLVSALLGALIPVAQLWATAHLVDALAAGMRAGIPAPHIPLTAVLTPYLPGIALLVGTTLLYWMFTMNIFQPLILARHADRVVAHFNERFFHKALSLRLEQLERPATYDLMQRARAPMQSDHLLGRLGQVTRLATRICGSAGILLALGAVHWALALLLLGGSALVLRWRIASTRRFIAVHVAQTPLQRRRAYWSSLLTERASAAEVRLFGLGPHVLARWEVLSTELLDEIATMRHRNLRRGILPTAANTAVLGLVALGLLALAGQGRLTAGALVALFFAVQQYLEMTRFSVDHIQKVQQFLADLRHIPAFMALADDEPKTGAVHTEALTDGVRFEQVSFTYPGAAAPALRDISLHIQPGEKVALVGLNGAGKTTLARLLLDLYQPTSGRILVDGVELRAAPSASWRAATAAVLQDIVRYPFTAGEQIGIGRLELLHDHAAIVAAAQKSGAASTIERLPRGYETLLGKEFADGADLSGGQWQQIAIARAHLRDALLIVLDEPAAALDARAEHAVYRQFLSLARGKTVLLISHRLGSARLADRIVVLDGGRVVEIGTHDELVTRGGPYAELYAIQAAWYQEEFA